MRDFLVEPEFIGFSNRADLDHQFNTTTEGTLLYCVYEMPPYEGYSDVWLEKDGQLMFNHGSHCSCYGLEGQWSPESFIPEQLIRMTGKQNWREIKPSLDFVEYVQANYDQLGKRKEVTIE